jgi:nitrile hydratase beta subunit
MNGVHDLGGLDGLGPVNPTKEGEEPYFHSDWEKTVFAMLLPALLAGINLDEFRHGIEKLHPVDYLSSRYYEHWLHTIEHGLIEKGVISTNELERRTKYFAEHPGAPLPECDDPEQVKMLLDILHAGASTKRETGASPRFKSGDTVAVRNDHPSGHTRSARYVRGKRGVVHRVYDSFVFPDTNARREGENAQYVYSVRFNAGDLWGEQTSEPNQAVYFDLWEPYLRAV